MFLPIPCVASFSTLRRIGVVEFIQQACTIDNSCLNDNSVMLVLLQCKTVVAGLLRPTLLVTFSSSSS